MTFGTFLFWIYMISNLSMLFSVIMRRHLSMKSFKIWFGGSAVVLSVCVLLILWCFINDGVLVKVSMALDTDGSIYTWEVDAMRDGIQLLLEDHLERSKPPRHRSCSIYNNDGSSILVDVPMQYELLGDDNEWRYVSEKEFNDFVDDERLKIQTQIATMERLLEELKGRD